MNDEVSRHVRELLKIVIVALACPLCLPLAVEELEINGDTTRTVDATAMAERMRELGIEAQ